MATVAARVDENPTGLSSDEWQAWRKYLAISTGGLHSQLDGNRVMLPLARQHCSRSDYTSALSVAHTVWSAYAEHSGWAANIALEAAKDLKRLNTPLNNAIHIPPLLGADKDGWDYVMWGSSKGAHLMLKLLGDSVPNLPHHYFNALSNLNGKLFTPTHPSDMCVEGAKNCFRFWIDCCNEHLRALES